MDRATMVFWTTHAASILAVLIMGSIGVAAIMLAAWTGRRW
jgi:hypothetical protein